MQDPQAAAELFAQTYERVLQERMLGLPLLNTRLQVETLGFQQFQGHIIGVLITPWMMNIVMLPREENEWTDMGLGHKLPQKFPGGTYELMINEIDGIGRYQAYSLYSPMGEFSNQDNALAAAESALRRLLTPTKTEDEAQVDEELLEGVLRGEETSDIDVDASESDSFGQTHATETPAHPAQNSGEGGVSKNAKEISRRDLLRGFLGGT